MIKTKIIFPVLLSLYISSFASAETPKYNNLLKNLQSDIDNQSYSSAWNTASKYADEYLGEPKFDFLYGVAALANNQAEHAVFAFERVVTNRPDWLDAHYLLAKANYKIANYQAAIVGSQLLVSNTNTPAPLKQSAATLINLSQTQLDKQSLYTSHRISLSLGHDSNINSGTNEDNIFLPFLDFSVPLSQESKESSDSYSALTYQLSGNKTLSQVSRILFSGQGALHKFNNESEYDRLFANVSIKYQRSFNFGRVTVGVKITPLWLDDDFYRTRSAITTDFGKQLTQKWTLTTGLSLGKTQNKINETLNTEDIVANFFVHYYSDNTKHSFGIDYADEKSELSVNNHNSRQVTTFSYSNLWFINKNWLATSMLAFQTSRYDDNHPFFLIKRNDDMWLGSASIQYSHSKTWSYRLNANAQNKDSNISLFSYQRSDISLSAIMSF